MSNNFFNITTLVFVLFVWSQPKPNLVVIMTDDMGYEDVGFNGCKDIPTPNIDSIAFNGANLVNGYVSFPVCSPSRAGFITGRYQDRFGYTTNPTIDPTNDSAGLPLNQMTMAEMLKTRGYKSAIIGKWHLGTHPKFHPINRGFDYFYGYLSGGHNYFTKDYTIEDLFYVDRPFRWYRTKLYENYSKLQVTDYKNEYLTDELSSVAVDFIEKQANENQNFMLFLSYNAPHNPLQATEKYLKRFLNIKNKKRKTYAAMVSAVDDGVGIIIKALRDKGIEENTIIVFLSDNGGAHNNSSSNYPLKGTKGSVYEGGLRVPFAIQWKGVIPPNTIYENSISSLDIMATMADILKIKKNKKMPLDGVNIIPYLTGEKKGEPHKYLFWRKWEQGAMAVIRGNFKLLKNNKQSDFELYNLKIDISESNNLIGTKPNLEKDLKEKWNIWNKGLKDRYYPSLGNDNWWEGVYKYENQD